MSADDIKNKAEGVAGKAKEAFGEATGDESTKAEGKVDQGVSDLKDKANEAKEKIAGKFNDLTDK